MKDQMFLVRKALCVVWVMAWAGFAWAQPASLNTAGKTPGKTNIAVINMKNASGVTAGEIEVISDRLRGELFNTGKVNVMERDQMQEILKEQGFQQSGACTNEACMVEIGQLLGVEWLVTGSLGKVGSMFLVNLRVIDVKTAKIVKVVSVDIKGDIERVVGELPDIASQLVGRAAQPSALERKEEPKKEEKKTVEEVKEEKPSVVEEKAPEVADERMERNKNRFGVRAGVNIFPGKGTRLFHLSKYDTTYFEFITLDTTFNYDDRTTNGSEPIATITRTPLMNYYVKGVLKAGKFITIDIGGGYSRQQIDYQWDYQKETNTADVFSFPSIGVNFVKRWYPLKLNAGIMADFNILSYTEEWYSRNYTDEPFIKSDTSYNYISLNGGFGARAGLEIMAGKHFGFNVDFVYYFSNFVTFPYTYEEYNSYGSTTYKADWQWNLTMPPLAVELGVNFYF